MTERRSAAVDTSAWVRLCGSKGRQKAMAVVILAAAAVLPAVPVQALDFPTQKGTVMLTGSGSGYYNGDEWPELAKALLTLLVIATAEEDGGYSQERHYQHDEEELGFSVPKAQYGAGVRYFLSSNLALGARYIYRQDFRENAIGRLWGGGPELVYFFGNYRDPVRPFVSAGLLRTQAVNRLTGERLEDGASVSLKGGLNIAMSRSVGLVLQTGYQNDRMSSPAGKPLVGRNVGIGVGFTASIY